MRMIKLTDSATNKVLEILAEENNPNLRLRIGVRPGGCSGLRYELAFDDKTDLQDWAGEYDGIPLVIDSESAPYLAGANLDFQGGLEGRGFVFSNPNETRSCGCGQSFS